MIRSLLIILILPLLSIAHVFRFDYEFNEQADGWLKFHVVPSTWQEARMRCHAEGAVIASPLTTELKNAIIFFVQRKKGRLPIVLFTGVHASFSKGDYTSVEGVPLSRLAITWSPGEPDNYANTESCLTMMTDSEGSMSDVRCDDVFPYVCYKKFTHLTMSECGTTDHAYIMEPRTGSCYKLHSRGLVWNQAFMTCLAEGGYLAIINSDVEANVIKEISDKTPQSSQPEVTGALGIGFHDWGHHMTFLTIHGETFDKAGYEVWSENQPDNATRERTEDKGESCGSVFKVNLRLNDVWCNMPIHFICEKSPNSLF